MITFQIPTAKEYQEITSLINKSDMAFKNIYSQEEAKVMGIAGETIESLQEGEIDRNYLCMYENESMVGFASFRTKNKQTCWLSQFYIHPNFQKQGFGSILLQEIEKIAKKQQHLVLVLETEPKATWAVKFYKKNNYKILPDKDLQQFPFDQVLNKPQVPGRYIFGKKL